MKKLGIFLFMLLVTEAVFAVDYDTFYVKTDDDAQIKCWSSYHNTNYGGAATFPMGTSSVTANVILMRFVNLGSLLGDSLYFVQAKLGLYWQSVSTAGRVQVRKHCRKYDEGTATWIHYDKRAGADKAFTTAGGQNMAECAGGEDTGDSTGTDTDDDQKLSDSIGAAGWQWCVLDSLDVLDRLDSGDSLNLWIKSSTITGTANSSDYSTDTTLTPRIMLVLAHFPDYSLKPGLHDGDVDVGYFHNGDKSAGRLLHRGDW